MVGAPVDFNTVQWARKRSAELEPLLKLADHDLQKLAGLLEKLAQLKAAEVTPTPAQMTVLLQHLHSKTLDKLEAVRGGLMVQFCGGGYAYESFLLKEDGRIPNHKYQSRRAS